MECEGLERVSCEDRCRLSKSDVAGGLAAAQVVVIQSGQVVVDERISVNHLERRAELRGGSVECAGSGDHPCRFEAQDRSQPLAAGKGAVSHGAMDGAGCGGGGWKQTLEGLIRKGCAGFEELLNVRGHRT